MEQRITTRRGFLVGGAASVGAAAAGFAAGSLLMPGEAPQPQQSHDSAHQQVPFFGSHQAGISDPTPTYAAFLGFDLPTDTSRSAVAGLMRKWTSIAGALAVGDTAVDESLATKGTDPSLFTMTVGISGAALDILALSRPVPLVDHPVFPGDQLDEAASYGHLFVQLCSNDPLYLAGAIRTVRRTSAGTLKPRWQFNGFRNATASSATRNGRNLMGQIDGTNNIAVSRATEGGTVWVSDAGPGWLEGGSYVAIRRFRMLLNPWENAGRPTQDRTIGRHLDTGAPLGRLNETDPVDLDAVTSTGESQIPVDAHIRLAAPRTDKGEEMLRRSYSYSTGQSTVETGDEDAGLIFVSYQSDPTTSFIPVQQRLAERDALNSFTVTTSSALFAVFPGVQDKDDWYGRVLLS